MVTGNAKFQNEPGIQPFGIRDSGYIISGYGKYRSSTRTGDTVI